MGCSKLQCVAVCCSVLQCVAVCCSVWQDRWLRRANNCCSVSLFSTVFYFVLQRVAVNCSVLQCVAVCSRANGIDGLTIAV